MQILCVKQTQLDDPENVCAPPMMNSITIIKRHAQEKTPFRVKEWN